MIENEIRQYLENQGFGTSNVDLFDTFKPNAPNNLIVVEDVSALPLDESSCLSIDNIGIMITVRNEIKDNAKSLIWNIHEKLIGFSGYFVVGGKNVTYVTQENPPHALGRDDENRMEYEVTYNCRVQTPANNYRL